MLKLGYFHRYIFASETFIYDLVNALSIDPDIDLFYISGQKEIKVDFKLNIFPNGFEQKFNNIDTLLYNFGQVFGRNGSFLKYNFRNKVAKNILNKAKIPKLDVAYVEYATKAVILMDYFTEKKIPFIVHIHGFDVTCSLIDEVYKKQLFILFEKAFCIIVPSNHIKRLLITLGCEPEKIKVIYPITQLNTITPESWDERLKFKPTVTFLGRLAQKKNPIALVHAFQLVSQSFRDANFTIIGDGPLKQEVIDRINKLNLNDKILLTGALDRNEAFKYLNKSWVYAQHCVSSFSGDQEGFPVSMAEAAAHALPMVSTIHSGITENIIDGETGFLVQEYDFEKMAEKIIYLLKNPYIAKKMGENGRKNILDLCERNNRTQKIKELMFLAANK